MGHKTGGVTPEMLWQTAPGNITPTLRPHPLGRGWAWTSGHLHPCVGTPSRCPDTGLGSHGAAPTRACRPA